MGRSAWISVMLGAAACSLEPPPPAPQTVVLQVESDPGKPLKDAAVVFNGRKIAVTGEDGVAEVRLAGKDGEAFDVTIGCPKGFESPSKPVRVMFRRLADASKKPRYEIRCPPTVRTIVVAVRADGGPNMPVTLLGREVARTDTSGAAHVMLRLEPGEQFDLVLDTSAERFAHLRPQNPAASFGVGHQDDIFTFSQKFEVERPRTFGFRGRAAFQPRPRGPVRIGGN